MDAAHDFCEITNFCKKCGSSEKDFLKGYRPHCDVKGNVTGISHILALKWMKEKALVTVSSAAAS